MFKYTWTPEGKYNTITFPNGQTRSYGYDGQGRLTQAANVHPTAGNLATYTYGYDINNIDGTFTRLGQLTSMTATVPGQGLSSALTKYDYDSAYQLTHVEYPNVAPFNGESDSWTYDAIGNRTSAILNGSTTPWTYQKIGSNPNNWQRLLSDGASAYGYDGNGNTTTIGGLILTWSQDNRLIGLSGSANASYAFDYRGRRTSAGGSAFLYDGENRIKDAGASSSQYLFGPSLDEPLAGSLSGTPVEYYAVDALGSIALGTDPAGNVLQSYTYDAWGAPRGINAPIVQPFGFTGREFGEAGFYYYRARQYASAAGRFLSEDPINVRDAANLYSYVANAPTMFSDPMGAERKCIHASYAHFIWIAAILHHYRFFAASPPPASARTLFNYIHFDATCDCGKHVDAAHSVPIGGGWWSRGAYPAVQFYVVMPPGDRASIDVSVSTTWTLTVGAAGFYELAREMTLCYDCN